MLLNASLPFTFPDYALETATYLHNILPTKILPKITSFPALFHNTPTYIWSYSSLWVSMLSQSHIYYPHKLAQWSTPCIFLDYPKNHWGYCCFDMSTNKHIISRHVTFVETHFPYQQLTQPQINMPWSLPSHLHPFLVPLFRKLTNLSTQIGMVAMNDEHSDLIQTRTWELVPRPTRVIIVNCMWLFRHKEMSNSDLKWHKTCLVYDLVTGTGCRLWWDL